MIPKTGKCTLIDFDWFSPELEFFQEYKAGDGFSFYNNPPESLLVKSVQTKLETDPSRKIEEDSYVFDSYVKNNNTYLLYRFDLERSLTRAKVQKANQANFGFANTVPGNPWENRIKHIQDFYFAMAKTFDSYGLGQCLLELSYRIFSYRLDVDEFPQTDRLTDRGRTYTEKEQVNIREHLKRLYLRILLPMIELEMSKRASIDTSVQEMQALLTSFLATPKRGGRNTRKRTHVPVDGRRIPGI